MPFDPNALLQQLDTDLRAFIDKSKGQIKSLEGRLDAIEVGRAAPNYSSDRGASPFTKAIDECESLKRLLHDKRGIARVELAGDAVLDLLQRKSVTSLGFGTVGVLPSQRTEYVGSARRQLRMRDVLPVINTTTGQVYWPKLSVAMTKASPVAEAGTKPEVSPTFDVASETVKTLAIWCTASRQALDDWAELQQILRDDLTFEVLKEEDTQVLFGSGTGQDFNGITTQAQAWDLSMLTASDGYEYIDIVSGGAQQIAEDDELPPTFVVLHPGDWWKMRRTKDSTGRYILGDPQVRTEPLLWDLAVASTTGMTKGSFMVGSFLGAQIRQRMEMTIDISTEHSDYFAKNLIAIRAELRGCVTCKRPNAFIYGSLTQSPI